MKKRADRARGERGEVMLEAIIVIIPVIILLMAMLALFFWFYQESMMYSVANEIAEEVATNIKYNNLGVNEIPTADDVKDRSMYRMTFNAGGVATKQQNRAEAYAEWRIPISTFGLSSGEARVECKVTLSGIGRAFVKVHVTQETETFLDGFLKVAGIIDDENNFGGTAYAECVDPMGYTSTVNFVRYLSKQLGKSFGAIGNMYTSAKDLLKALGF